MSYTNNTQSTKFKTLTSSLSVRANNVLSNLNIDSVEKLLSLNFEYLAQCKNCGIKTAKEILSLKDSINKHFDNSSSTIGFDLFLLSLPNSTKNNLIKLKINNFEDLVCLEKSRIENELKKTTQIKDIVKVKVSILLEPQKYNLDINKIQISKRIFLFPLFLDINCIEYLNLEFIEELPQHIFERITTNLSVRSQNIIEKLEVNNLFDLLLLTSNKIKSCKNAGANTISNIKEVTSQVLQKVLDPSSADNEDCYDFESLHDFISKTHKMSEKMLKIMLLRLGYYNKVETLEECGTVHGITRERARQLESKAYSRIESEKTFLELFKKNVQENLKNKYGIESLSVLKSDIDKKYHFNGTDSELFFSNFINKFCGEEILCQDNIVILKEHECFICNKTKLFFKSILQKNEMIKYEELKNEFRNFCLNNCGFKDFEMPSEALFEYYINNKNILNDKSVYSNGVLISAYKYILEKGSLSKAFEEVLKRERKPMHATEVIDIIKKYRDNFDVSNNRAVGLIGNNPNNILWGQGTYIHISSIDIDKATLSQIKSWIVEELNSGIPFISSYRVFENFKEKLETNKIDNDYALYSSMRLCGFDELVLPHYPQIYLSNKHDKISIHRALEDFILNNDGVISIDELQNYAFNKIGVKEFQYNQFFIENMEFINDKNNNIVYLDGLDYDQSAFLSIVAYCQEMIQEHINISVEKVYKDKKVTCKLAKISTPRILFGLIKKLDHNIVKCGSYPTLFKNDQEKPSNSVIKSVVSFIKEKEDICCYDELSKYFIKKLGFKESIFHNALYGDYGINLYSKGCYIHGDYLKFSEQDVSEIMTLLNDEFNVLSQKDKFFMLTEDFLYSHEDELPIILENIPWTGFCLSAVLDCGTYKFIGANKNIICKDFETNGMDYFIYKYLNIYCNGYAKINDLELRLQEEGVIRKNISKSTLLNSAYISQVDDEVISMDLLEYDKRI